MVIMLPVVLAVMFLGMQGGLYYHARTVAIAAAQSGARAAGAQGSTGAQGAAAAADFVASAGGSGVVTGLRVSVLRTAAMATVTVRGQALSVIAGWSPTVTQSASVPVERITR